MNKTIGILQLITVGLVFVGSASGADSSFYTEVAFGLMILGIWGGILLIKSEIKNN